MAVTTGYMAAARIQGPSLPRIAAFQVFTICDRNEPSTVMIDPQSVGRLVSLALDGFMAPLHKGLLQVDSNKGVPLNPRPAALVLPSR